MKPPVCRVAADALGQFHLNIQFETTDLKLAFLENMSPADVAAVVRSDGLAQLLLNIKNSPTSAIANPGLAAGLLTNLCFEAEGEKSDEYSPEGLRRCLDAIAQARVQPRDEVGANPGAGHV